MPVSKQSNNRILPANSRAVDVAKLEIQNLAAVQQRKHNNALEVGGFESIIYTQLRSGVPCSCQAHDLQLAALLGEDGKMPEGKMNELLTGMIFEVQPYGARQPVRPDLRGPMGLPAPSRTDQQFDGLDNPNTAIQPPIEIVDDDLTNPFVDRVVDNTTKNEVGSNGPIDPRPLDDFAGDFDTNDISADDVACGICFGTGYVGGYAVTGGYRVILSTEYPDIVMDGTLEANHRPHYFRAKSASFTVTLPKGFVSLDAMKVYNNTEILNKASVYIDNILVAYPSAYNTLINACDGLSHTLTVKFAAYTEWTHLEFQFNLSRQPFRIEFPKLQQTSDLTKLDTTDDVQISASASIPTLNPKDLIVESTFGKAFIVETSNWWNDRLRNVLGWDCTARVIQPNEILNLLPRRKVMKQAPTHMVRSNPNPA